MSNPIRIGFCTDLSGPFQSVDGPGGAEAIRMAIADLDGSVAERPVELLLGDHRNDVTESASIARRWYGQEGVDVVISGVNSDTSLALTSVAAELDKPILIVGAGTSVQTRDCPAPGIIQYAYDTVTLATVPGLAMTRQGDKRWFYITADYPFGRELQAHGRAAVTGAGGTVVGSVLNPHEADDFTPYVQAALDSGAEVLGFTALHLLDVEAAPDLHAPAIRLAGTGATQLGSKNAIAWEDGKVRINEGRWFETVPREAWEFRIGGYQPAQKWLKDRAGKGGANARDGRTLTDDDVLHYRRFVTAMQLTIPEMAAVDATIERHGGWPDAFGQA